MYFKKSVYYSTSIIMETCLRTSFVALFLIIDATIIQHVHSHATTFIVCQKSFHIYVMFK